MDTTFEERLKQGRPAEQLAIDILKSYGYTAVQTGVEHQPDNHRHTPDLCVMGPTGRVWFEVKSANTINQWCYEHCVEVAKTEPVFLLIPDEDKPNAMRSIRITDLKFHHYFKPWQNSTSSPLAGSGQPWAKFLTNNGHLMTMKGGN